MNLFLNPSGGLFYHWKAFKYKNKFWYSFKSEIGQWLEKKWNPQSTSLVLIGPSAGYQLEESFLKKFQKIYIYEPDPIAVFLFTKKLKKLQIYFEVISKPVPFIQGDQTSLDGLRELRTQHLGSCFLFCNLIGQLPVLYKNIKESQWIVWSHEFVKFFQGLEWASYHDVFSGNHDPDLEMLKKIKNLKNSHQKKNFLQTIYSHSIQSSGKNSLEVIDHKLFHGFSALSVTYFKWQIQPGFFHLIAGVCQRENQTESLKIK